MHCFVQLVDNSWLPAIQPQSVCSRVPSSMFERTTEAGPLLPVTEYVRGFAVQTWLESLSPEGNNTFLNLAKPSTESTFYAHCLHDTLPEELNVDLVILEFAINDMRWDTRITPYMANSKRRAPQGGCPTLAPATVLGMLGYTCRRVCSLMDAITQ